MPTLDHQRLVQALGVILHGLVVVPGLGDVFPGANVSDRRGDWKENYRIPDLIVMLHDGAAEDCGSYILGGPDLVVEIESPGDDTDDKIPFYSAVGCRELLIIHRDTRDNRLYHHDGNGLNEVALSEFQKMKWLISTVVPLAFRRKTQRGQRRTEITRTDSIQDRWII
jgi:Uma2 family endonuclease